MFHIIDDMPFIRDLMKNLLDRFGFSSLLFENAESYIDYVKSSDFSLPIAVFTDVMMDGMNGYEMIGILSDLRSDLKFVILTGECSIRSSQMEKACMFLSKPFRQDDFLKVISSLVRCNACSPSPNHGCKVNDDRRLFPIENWNCPHMEKPRA